MEPAAHRVVIIGGGIAGLEAMMVLGELGGDHVDVTVVSPSTRFSLRALSVADPFSMPSGSEYSVATACTEHGAKLIVMGARRVDTDAQVVELEDGRDIPYDSLLIATGADTADALGTGIVFRGTGDAEMMRGLVRDVEGGYTKRVAFVVPPGTTWPLPLYELALMLAERAGDAGFDDLDLHLVTPESAPLEVFGAEVAEATSAALQRRGITLHAGRTVTAVSRGTLTATPGLELEGLQRIVAVPRLSGTALPGLPHDDERFLPVDPHGRVLRCSHVWAAGDGTDFPVKQGALAAQEAAAAASEIARVAGADVSLKAFRPVLRAELMTGLRSLWLRHAVPGTGAAGGSGTSATRPPWWPDSKVVAPYLTAWMDSMDLRASTPRASLKA